ncbi:YybH family protein [Chitinophaga flava]|uniref:DUF4440 domain-containing protein n=1 Tax=Chitinophaga flava TaxID=2259036 RepID=A0A365XZ94_9BACT|nr:nuclear transport factor 2 family protein [Chitinophaga flava]RBL91672.1 hypothetical protein DF182_03405 [Chitinophaga flava]
MKIIGNLLLILLLAGCTTKAPSDEADIASLKKTTQAIRDAFARGDVAALVKFHHPHVIKYFGGNNVVDGRQALEKGLVEMFRTARMEFVDHKLESLVIHDGTAVETSIFTIKVTPKNGEPPTLSHGRAMVVYVRDKDNPSEWVSIREMAQAAP